MPFSLLVKTKNSRSGDKYLFETCVLVGSGTGLLVGSGTGVLVGSSTGVLVGSGTGLLVGSGTGALVSLSVPSGSLGVTSCAHPEIMNIHTMLANVSFNII